MALAKDRAYRDLKIHSMNSDEAKRVLLEAHGPPIHNNILTVFNGIRFPMPVRNVDDCEKWLQTATASMHNDLTIDALAPAIKYECWQCARAICQEF